MTRHDNDNGSVGVAIYFHPLANALTSRVPGMYWTVADEERLPSGYLGLSYRRPRYEYVWFRHNKNSKLDNELCALLGLVLNEYRK